ncbi:hypothetical protein BH18ACI5_BH18ACI5_06650 [soil metagenome]
MNRNISNQAWRALSARLGINEATLKAVAEVESSGDGFLPPPSNDPKILFEGHAFHRLTQGRFTKQHPDISYPKWTKAHYAKTPKTEWDRLNRARALDRDAANQSASWGAFQIMGFNYGLSGFSNLEAFVAAQCAGADEQLDAFAQFVGRDWFLVPLRAKDWATFAPDAVDLRDWVYRPAIATAPRPVLWPHHPLPTTNQGRTSACTGFSLATVIEHLLARADRPVEPISGFMLYSMAKRYDEWTDNDKKDEGSSLRGALKGWSRHGASKRSLWTKLNPPSPSNKVASDWWLDSVKRPLGAYYRLTLDALTDIHSALMETGAVYASALTHGGWDELFVSKAQPAPTSIDEIPVIECRRGLEDGGHAFAIVGYTEKGFLIQNSWGTIWGRGGFAILTYSDWRQNAMDAWVVQLGVVTKEHEEVGKASSLRTERKSGRVVISSDPRLSAHEVSPFIINMQNEGRLSDRGQFRTFDSDLEFLLDHHLNTAARREWQFETSDTIDVALYAHGGLVDESAAAESARQWVPLLYSNRIFPIFLMWETDLLSTVFNSVQDAVEGQDRRVAADWWNRFKNRVVDWKDERIEGLTRAPGGLLWGQMKDNADDISGTKASGVVKLFEMFKTRRRRLPRLRLHLIGHSAGAIVQAHLGDRALDRDFEIGSST